MREQLDAFQEIDETAEERRAIQVGRLIGEIEKVVDEGLAHFPGESYLLDLEARLATLVNDMPRASAALERALNRNPGNGFISVRLARHYRARGDMVEAKAVLARCLEHNPTHREAHVQLAILLGEEDESGQREAIRHHLRRRFSPGDTNYRAQVRYARHEFLFGDLNRAREAFDNLKKAKIDPQVKQRPMGKVMEADGRPRVYRGSVRTKMEGHCFVTSADLSDDVFMHAGAFQEGEWDGVTAVSEPEFELAFTLRGPIGQKGRVVH